MKTEKNNILIRRKKFGQKNQQTIVKNVYVTSSCFSRTKLFPVIMIVIIPSGLHSLQHSETFKKNTIPLYFNVFTFSSNLYVRLVKWTLFNFSSNGVHFPCVYCSRNSFEFALKFELYLSVKELFFYSENNY